MKRLKIAATQFCTSPKFHCELNYIEMVWAMVKAHYRSVCRFSFEHLRNSIDQILTEIITTEAVRNFSQHCERFMDGYRMGMKGPLLDFAMKKHSRHRSFSTTVTVAAFEA